MRQKFAPIFFISLTIVFITFIVGYMLGRISVETTPYIETNPMETATNSYTDPIIGHKININTADKEMIAMLDGIGDVLAERIVKYRNENGPFDKIEDIMNVSGIGEKKFDQIAEYITTGG